MRTNLNGILTLLLAFVVHLSFAQDKTISGNVTDFEGLPLPGVNILVEGTTTGTQTDFDGNYSISASQGQVLLFTYIGQKPERAVIGVGTSINVVMQLDAEALEEVVVTALGIKRSEKSIGYAVQDVKGESIAETQEPNLINALNGKVSGAQITNSSGAAGASSRIVLRGASSITGNNEPLFVVDGIPIDNSNQGDADAIEVVSICRTELQISTQMISNQYQSLRGQTQRLYTV